MAGATTTKTTAVARSPGASLALNSVADLQQLADMLYKGGLTPPGIDSPNKVAAVILAGLEVGLAPTQALGSIMLTNGRLSIYGDGALALVRASGLLGSISEKVEGEGNARTGTCAVERKGEPAKIFTFSMAQAINAGLIERAKGKDGKARGPWISYPDRMLLMRARGFALRDVFPDVLRGLITFEEAQDGAGDVIDTEVKVVGTTANPPAPVAATPPAAPPVAPVAPPAPAPAPTAAPAPAVAPAAQIDGPVTDDQKAQFLELRKLVCASVAAHTPDEQRAAWSAALAPFGVTSVAQLTAATADKVLAELGTSHDPFSHPPTSSGSLI
jgi:hypothetical protein